MQIVTLQQVKDQLGVTFTATDAVLTLLANGIEAEIFAYLNAATKEQVLEAAPARLGSAMAEAALVNAVLVNLAPRRRDSAFDIWKGGRLARMLFPFRIPGIGVGSTS